jgi:hypothetical protein
MRQNEDEAEAKKVTPLLKKKVHPLHLRFDVFEVPKRERSGMTQSIFFF